MDQSDLDDSVVVRSVTFDRIVYYFNVPLVWDDDMHDEFCICDVCDPDKRHDDF